MDLNIATDDLELEAQIDPSSDTSEITGVDHNSKAFSEPDQLEQNSNQQKSEWTDEKHTLFLNSLEASFVEQMQNQDSYVRGFRSCLLKNHIFLKTNSNSLNGNMNSPSDKFKVMNKGCWKKINFVENQSDATNEPRLLSSNRWIQHFMQSSSGKGLQDARLSNPLEDHALPTEAIKLNRRKYRSHFSGLAECANHPQSQCSNRYCQDSIGCTTEVSGQNFVDEDSQNIGQSSSSPRKRKRENILGADVSMKDQVVPYRETPAVASPKEDESSRRE